MRKPKKGPVAMRFGDAELLKFGASGSDPYTIATSVSWTQFFLLLLLTELAINTVFATLYTLGPGSVANARPGSFVDAFFFSVETLATVGYGVMAPATLYGHIVSASEIVCGLIFTAIFTGLIFVRFSKPRPNILFADCGVIARHNGKPTLMIRVANGRQTALVGASAQLALLKPSISQEGRPFRQAFELRLVRDTSPLFLLTWTLMHRIDKDSPLYNANGVIKFPAGATLVLSIYARDHTAGADVFDLRIYDATRILPGMVYKDAVTFDERGRPNADLSKLSLVEEETDPVGDREPAEV